MIVHNLKQGTPEWEAFRFNHHGASEAAAMMGCHPTIKRNELIRMKATGTAKEFTAWVQENILDKGHLIEAAMRPRAEEIIGDDLYPVTGSLGKESASFDGLPLVVDIHWECKTINVAVRAAETAADLPLYYRVQLEHQLMVRDGTRALFSAGNIDDAGNIIEEKHLWYDADLNLREEIIKGWAQLDKDVADYEHVEIIERPKGAAVIDLPAVMVNVSGQISITDNLGKFTTALTSFIEQDLITKPESDQDFADLESQIKTLKKAEEALDSAESNMLAQVDAVDTAKRMIDMARKMARDNRLMAEKLVKTEKERIKTDRIMLARNQFRDHISALNAEISPVNIEGITPDFNGAAKNKRTMASLYDALDTELARVKIEADAQAKQIRTNLAVIAQHEAYRFLFNDLATIAHKAPDDFAALVAHRVSEHKAAEQARIEAERERIRQQEEARAQAEADRRLRESAEQAERQRRMEAEQRTAVDTKPIENERDRLPERTYIDTTPAERPIGSDPIDPDEPATLKVGDICTRLGITVTADFVTDTLGIEPAEIIRGRAVFRESQWHLVCSRLIEHVRALREVDYRQGVAA